MKNIIKSETYKAWIAALKDRNAVAHIYKRIDRLSEGNPGDVKHFGDISEMRIHCGAGYRVYYTTRKNKIYILLCGGDKTTQQADFKKARELLKDVESFL